MLYVHPMKIENYDTISKDEIQKLIDEFDPFKQDTDFAQNMY